MRVAVTGANGFVGRNLLIDLDRGGIDTVALSRRPIEATRWRASPALDGDDQEAWAQAFSGVDAVVHCAARAHVMHEQAADPRETFRHINHDGAIAMAHGAAKAGVRRIVFLSTVKVLGETTSGRGPFRNDDPPAPEDAYAISKTEAESSLAALARKGAFELVVLRPPLVYGPGVGGNIASLVNIIRRGLWLPLGGARGNRRSMISTANLSDAILAALITQGAAGGQFLVSDGHDISTRELVEALSAAAGRPARLVAVPVRPSRALLRLVGREALWTRLFGDLQVDISDTCKRLDWSPALGVAAGLATVALPPQQRVER